jgi:hypothetical protein
VTNIECGSIVRNLETADDFNDFDYYYSYYTCWQLFLAKQAQLDYYILNKLMIVEIRMF